MKAEIRYRETVEEISLPEGYWTGMKIVCPENNICVSAVEIEYLEEHGIRVGNVSEITRTFPDDTKLTITCCCIEEWDITPEILNEYKGMKHIDIQTPNLSCTIFW